MDCRRYKTGGFSLIELMVVIAIILVLAGMLLPALTRGKMKARQTECGGNLRQAGLAFRMFADDHENRLPMQVSVRRGGTSEYATRGETWRHFQVMSNLLVDPKLLVCPADQARFSTNWTKLGALNLSYFVGLDAKIGASHHLLAGDRNILTPGYVTPGVVPVRPEMQLFWTEDLHRNYGNLLFGDGHVQSVDSEGLQRLVTQHASK